MSTFTNPQKVHGPLGAYSHTVKVPPGAEWLAIAGQVGVNRGGQVVKGIDRQAEQAFRNILACLKEHGMGKEDLVKLNVYLTDSRFIGGYRAAREKVIGNDVVPASTLLIIAGLASPDMHIEVEAWAAKG